jgi:hypothetical protein
MVFTLVNWLIRLSCLHELNHRNVDGFFFLKKKSPGQKSGGLTRLLTLKPQSDPKFTLMSCITT